VVALGFDVEYATIDKGGKSLPALLSLATPTAVHLIRLHCLPGRGLSPPLLPPSLLLLLADPGILKVGVGVFGDARSLVSAWRGKMERDRRSTPPTEPKPSMRFPFPYEEGDGRDNEEEEEYNQAMQEEDDDDDDYDKTEHTSTDAELGPDNSSDNVSTSAGPDWSKLRIAGVVELRDVVRLRPRDIDMLRQMQLNLIEKAGRHQNQRQSDVVVEEPIPGVSLKMFVYFVLGQKMLKRKTAYKGSFKRGALEVYQT
jgi:hypothetical protein